MLTSYPLTYLTNLLDGVPQTESGLDWSSLESHWERETSDQQSNGIMHTLSHVKVNFYQKIRKLGTLRILSHHTWQYKPASPITFYVSNGSRSNCGSKVGISRFDLACLPRMAMSSARSRQLPRANGSLSANPCEDFKDRNATPGWFSLSYWHKLLSLPS